MLAVSNTSPLYYLIAVGKAELLGQLFGEVLIPPGVASELAHPSRPAAIRQWIDLPLAWLRTQVLKEGSRSRRAGGHPTGRRKQGRRSDHGRTQGPRHRSAPGTAPHQIGKASG